MNKMLLVCFFLAIHFISCRKSEPSNAENIQIYEYLISPKILDLEVSDETREAVTYNVKSDMNNLIKWLCLSPIGKAAYPRMRRDCMYDSLMKNLSSRGDTLCLIYNTYIFNIDGENIMIQVILNLMREEDNKFDIKIILTRV